MRNLAYLKSVTTSAYNPSNLATITDGVMYDKDLYAAISSNLQWVQIDLGGLQNINNIKVWHYYDGRIYHDVIIRLSNDPEFITGVTTVFNNDTDNSCGFGIGTDAEFVTSSDGLNVSFNEVYARYARFYTRGNSKNIFNHYVEIEIYGNENYGYVKPVIEPIKVFDKSSTSFASNGLGVLHECIKAEISEGTDGEFEIFLEYPLDTRGKWKNLIDDNIIYADGQPFRIYRKKKTIKKISVWARQIAYDLLDNFVESLTLTSTPVAAFTSVLSHTQYAHPFTCSGDLAGSADYVFDKTNPINCLTGSKGIINTVGGEIEFDNYNIILHQMRGSDQQVLVAYGKNIEGIEESLDKSSMCTCMMPLGKDDLMIDAKYVNSPLVLNYSHPIVRTVKFPDIEDKAVLLSAAESYFGKSGCDLPIVNYKIDFVELSKTEQYKDYSILETVGLGDTVTVRHSVMNLDLKVKVIKITKNVITDRIIKIELGSFKKTVTDSIETKVQGISNQVLQVISDYQLAVDNATKLITGESGGYVKIIRDEVTNLPKAIAIMNTDSELTADKVWLWNNAGLGYSSGGIDGPYTTAITYDGKIVADFVTAGGMSAGMLKTGTLVSTDGSLSINIANGAFTIGGGTGDVAKHTDTYSKWMHGANDYTIAQASGLVRHVGSLNKDYHYLIDTGEALTSDANAVKIPIDPSFIGKPFVVTVSVMDTENPTPYKGETMVGFTAYVDDSTYNYTANPPYVYAYGYGNWYDARDMITDWHNNDTSDIFYISGLRLAWTAIQ